MKCGIGDSLKATYNEVKAKQNNVTTIQNYVLRLFQISNLFRAVCNCFFPLLFYSISFIISLFFFIFFSHLL